MVSVSKILFPVDLSESSKKIVPSVKYVMKAMGAVLSVVFVVQDIENYAGFYVPHPSMDLLTTELHKGASKRLEEFVTDNFEDVGDVKADIVSGDPAEEIIKYVHEKEVDLIIMGTHGRTGIDRIIFGSVAEKVVKLSPVPVLTINPYKIG